MKLRGHQKRVRMNFDRERKELSRRENHYCNPRRNAGAADFGQCASLWWGGARARGA